MTLIKCTRLLWLTLGIGSVSAQISMKLLQKVYSLKETELPLQDLSLQSSASIWEGAPPALTAPKRWRRAGFQYQVLLVWDSRARSTCHLSVVVLGRPNLDLSSGSQLSCPHRAPRGACQKMLRVQAFPEHFPQVLRLY